MHPTIGRIVHYAEHPGSPWVPAIITRVFTDECVNLRTFPDNDGGVLFVSSVMNVNYLGNGNGPRWQWPPRAE